MKKSTFILTVLIVMTIKTNAQIPNSGFEDWTTVGGYEDPTGWASTNSFSTGSFYSVTKSTDHYPATVGNYSVRIENNTSLLPNFSGRGVVMTGDTLDPHPTFPITGHPTSLTGYYKFAPQNGDTMSIVIGLYLNGVRVFAHDQIFISNIPTSDWTSFNISFPTYAAADSGHIYLASYAAADASSMPHGNSVLYVDNLNFDKLITSVSEQTVKNTLFNLYPNPASDILTLNFGNRNNADLTLNIYNVTGELVSSETLRQNQQQINIGELSNGIYMVEIKSNGWSENQKLIIQR